MISDLNCDIHMFQHAGQLEEMASSPIPASKRTFKCMCVHNAFSLKPSLVPQTISN